MKNFNSLIKLFSFILLTASSTTTFGQAVSINATGTAPDPQSILDISASDKGVLLPRLADHTDVTPSSGSDFGLTVYDLGTSSYWYWDGAVWREIPNTAGIVTTLDGAYDGGGSGVGRSITVDAGSVQMNGSGGSVALETDGDIQLAEDQWIGLGSTIERIEFDGSLNRIDIEAADLTMDDGTWIGVDASSPRIEFEDASGRLNMQDADIELDAGSWIGVGSTTERIEFDGANGEVNVLGAEFGVNTTAPTEQLDVNGQIRMRTGATLNYIPVGDANGVMTWTDPNTVFDNDDDWYQTTGTNTPTAIGDWIYTNGNVGINVGSTVGTLPLAALHAQSNAYVGDYNSGGFFNTNATLHLAKNANPHILLEDIGTNTGGLSFDGNGLHVATENGNIDFKTGVTFNGDFSSTGTARMTILNGGNVGIADATPDYLLDVAGDIGLDNRLYHNDDPNTYIEFTPDRIQMFAGSGTSSWIDIQSTASEIAVNENNLNRDFRVEGGTDVNLFFVDGSADFVGIATNAPTTELDVNGQIRMRTGATIGYIPVSNATGVMTWTDPATIAAADVSLDEAYDANGPGLGRTITADNGPVDIQGTAGLLVAGNVGIGTTDQTHRLVVNGTNSDTSPILSLRSGNDNGTFNNGAQIGLGYNGTTDYSHFIHTRHNSTGALGNAIDFYLSDGSAAGNSVTSASVQVMTLAGTGNVGIGVTNPTARLEVDGDATISGKFNSNGIQESSDVRFKKNINRLQDALQNVLKLEGVSYNWRVEEFPNKNFSEATEIGVIAQEIEKIYPELVSTDINGYKAVQYSHLVPVLIEAIKEQNRIINSQSQSLDDLNSANAVLTEDVRYIKAQLELLHTSISTSNR